MTMTILAPNAIDTYADPAAEITVNWSLGSVHFMDDK